MKAGKLIQLLGSIALVLTITVLSFLAGCSTTTTTLATTTTTASVSTVSAPASTSAVSSTSTSPLKTTTATKTLKIGYIGWLGFFIGVDGLRSTEIVIDIINQQGGLNIGGENYNIELISYDSNNDQATAVAAANKLIFNDNVKFIIADGFCTDAIIPITEANKVVLCAADQSPAMFSADNHFSFNAANAPMAILGWFVEAYPEKKNMVIALPDSRAGQNNVEMAEPAIKAFGLNVDFEFYPASATDLSSLGTKVKTLNPDVFISMAGTYQPYASVWQAGYRGLLFSIGPLTTVDLLTQLTPEQLEGFVGAALPTEFDPALTQTSQDFKTAWIAKYGSWTEPQTLVETCFSCLTAALEKAGSLDTEAVASAIGNGLQFDTPMGQAEMFSRPDVGIDRTVDCLAECFVKKIVGGKPTLIATVGTDKILDYFRQIYK